MGQRAIFLAIATALGMAGITPGAGTMYLPYWRPGVPAVAGAGIVAKGGPVSVSLSDFSRYTWNDTDSGQFVFINPVTGAAMALFRLPSNPKVSVDLGSFPAGAPLVFGLRSLHRDTAMEYTGPGEAGTYDFDADPALKSLAVNHRPEPVGRKTNIYGYHISTAAGWASKDTALAGFSPPWLLDSSGYSPGSATLALTGVTLFPDPSHPPVERIPMWPYFPRAVGALGAGIVAKGGRVRVVYRGHFAASPGRFSILNPNTGIFDSLFSTADPQGTLANLPNLAEGTPLILEYQAGAFNTTAGPVDSVPAVYTGPNDSGAFDFTGNPDLSLLAINHKPKPVGRGFNGFGDHRGAVAAQLGGDTVAVDFEDWLLPGSDYNFIDACALLIGARIDSAKAPTVSARPRAGRMAPPARDRFRGHRADGRRAGNTSATPAPR